MLTSVPAIYHALTRHPLFAGPTSPRPLGLLRRRADRRRLGARIMAAFRRAGGQRLRPDRDLFADDLPAP